jgi:hypothetical protein
MPQKDARAGVGLATLRGFDLVTLAAVWATNCYQVSGRLGKQMGPCSYSV